MLDTGQFDYTILGDTKPENPFLNLRILRHGAYLGYWIYIFTDGQKFYMHVNDATTQDPVETKEVSEDTFTSFCYAKEYINDLITLKSCWDIYGPEIQNGKTLSEIFENADKREEFKLGPMSPAWQAIRDGKKLSPPLLTGGRKNITKGVTNGN